MRYHVKLFSKLAGLPLFALVTVALAAETPPVASPATLTNWQTARMQFQQAGAAVGNGQPAVATATLAKAATNLPSPYGVMAARFGEQLAAALAVSADAENRARLKALSELCAAFGDYAAALHLQRKYADADDLADDPAYAWRLFESGDTAAALAEYRRRRAEEAVESFRAHFREQLQLVEQRAAQETNLTFALRLARQHYLRGLEEKADVFGAIQVVFQALPHAQGRQEAVAAGEFIIHWLNRLGDETGRDAWEDKLLRDWPGETETVANIYLARGLRAMDQEDYARAQALLGKVCAEFPDAEAWGDAQFNQALILERQGKYEDAVREYSKIFPSKVNDYKLDPDKSDDCKNYRHRAAMRISECYEAQKNWPQALAWAEAGRDRYQFQSFCSTCLRERRAAVDERIRTLQAAQAAATAPRTE